MKKRSIVLGIAAVLAMALVLSACEKGEEEIECGLLTIKNLPSVPSQNWYGEQVYWGGGIYFDEDITTQLGLHNWTVGGYNMVAYFDNDVPPFKLADSKEVLKGFLKSGSYSVYLYRATAIRGDTYFLSGVTFKNGKATIDFNDMTLEASLPYN